MNRYKHYTSKFFLVSALCVFTFTLQINSAFAATLDDVVYSVDQLATVAIVLTYSIMFALGLLAGQQR